MTEEATKETPAPARAARGSLVRTLVKVLIAVLALAFVVWAVPVRDRCTDKGCDPGLLTTLRAANAPLLGGLFVAYIAGQLAWAARWRALLGLAGVRVPLPSAWRITLEAQAGGILLPGGIAGDALRVTYARSRAPDAELAKIVASVFADRIVGLVTLAGLSTVAALVMGAGRVGFFFHAVAAIPLCAALGWIVIRRPSLAARPIFSQGILSRAVKPMLEYASAEEGPGVLLRGMLMSLLVSLVQLLVVRGIVLALGGRPDQEAWVYVGTTIGMMVGALPLLPGAWGTADAAYVFFLGQAGIPASVALSTCLVYRVFWYATGVVGGALAIARKNA